MPRFDPRIVSEVMIKQLNSNPSITLENISYLPIENVNTKELVLLTFNQV